MAAHVLADVAQGPQALDDQRHVRIRPQLDTHVIALVVDRFDATHTAGERSDVRPL